MGTMTKKVLFVMTILLVASFALLAADVSGKWTFEQPGRGGNPGRPVTITLKADGSTLTGTMPAGGRGGAPADPIAITDGKVDGNNISFTVKREMNGNMMITKYDGRQALRHLVRQHYQRHQSGGRPQRGGSRP